MGREDDDAAGSGREAPERKRASLEKVRMWRRGAVGIVFDCRQTEDLFVRVGFGVKRRMEESEVAFEVFEVAAGETHYCQSASGGALKCGEDQRLCAS